MIGKIERIKLREVWPHEALDFTRWLAQLRQLKAKYFFPDGGIVVAASWRGLILSNRNVVKTKLPSRLW